VLARIDAALGEGRALRPHLTDGARDERRSTMQPFTLEPLVTKTWNALPVRAALPSTATLQLRTVAPQPVAVRVIGGQPRFVGTPEAQVLDCAGPWRVDEGWWASLTGSGERIVRDEYDVLLDDGSLVRIARETHGWHVRGIYD
jgi:hypothetical protein